MLHHRPTRAALFACALLASSVATAAAQMPPYTAYGMGLSAGQVVTASIEGVECGSAKVSAAGNWIIRIGADAPCTPTDGSTVRFAVDGKDSAATVGWSGGGAPLNPRVGVVLGTSPTAIATGTPATTATARPVPRATVIASKTPTPKATTRPILIVPRPRPPLR